MIVADQTTRHFNNKFRKKKRKTLKRKSEIQKLALQTTWPHLQVQGPPTTTWIVVTNITFAPTSSTHRSRSRLIILNHQFMN